MKSQDKQTESSRPNELGSIVLEGVSKRFKKRSITQKSYTTTKSALLEKFKKKNVDEADQIVALDPISIRVDPGSSIAIIGRNGSGKSTLLKLISGIYRPDSGTVKVNGKVSALIELGAGFHPEFTGRENIYLGGVMYGLSKKEIDKRFDDIVAYAELEEFIDNPVKTYSSGMYMRLGFSLAVHTDPDIILIDEVLAVGDAAFIHRCQETISDFKRRGKTMVFVTHDLNSVERWCDEAVWLHKGVVKKRGEPRPVIDSYLSAIEEVEKEKLDDDNAQLQEAEPEIEEVPEEEPVEQEQEDQRWGNGAVEITSVIMSNEKGDDTWLFHGDEGVDIEVKYSIKENIEELVFGVGILRVDGVAVYGTNTDIESIKVPLPDSNASFPINGSYKFKIKRLSLLDNSYYLDVAAHKADGTPYDYHHRLHKFSVRNPIAYHGVCNPEHEWEFEQTSDGQGFGRKAG